LISVSSLRAGTSLASSISTIFATVTNSRIVVCVYGEWSGEVKDIDDDRR